MSKAITRFERQLRDEDAEDAREARVAVRRLRAQLVLADCFDPDWVWLLRRELRWVEQSVGDVVDVDALMCWVGRQSVDDRDEKARAELVAELTRERSRAHRRLVALLDSARYERMVRDLARPYRDPEELARSVGREWKSLKAVVASVGDHPGDQDLHRLAMRVDRVRHGAELAKDAAPWAATLADVREALDALQEASLAQGWLRHAAGTPTASWDLLSGQLLERARAAESVWLDEWSTRWELARVKSLRAWLKS
ncbi:MAG: CHAD domain-containing protein [Acidimicrobiales bacterium]